MFGEAVSAQEKNFSSVKNNAPPLGGCDTLANADGKRGAEDDSRVLGKTILHGLTIIVVGLRKYLKVERCEHCGR
jgi:hypothetical protein